MERLIVDFVLSSRDLGQLGLVLLAVSFFIISLAFLPRPPACIVAGLVYGVWAFPVVLVASTLGAAAGFMISRHLFQTRFRQAVERRPGLQSIVEAIDSEGWVLVALLRLASPVPGSVTTYLLGLSRIRLWPYIGATCLGLAPQTFLFIFMGAVGPAAFDGAPPSAFKLAFVLAGVVTSAIIIWLVGKRARVSLSTRLTLRAGDPHAAPPP
jgi:uncharacterized membrane protein YdjX (TVP38/TMEM64 family)